MSAALNAPGFAGTIFCTLAILACVIADTVCAASQLGIETHAVTIRLHTGGATLWDYGVPGLDRRHGIAAPIMNLNGR